MEQQFQYYPSSPPPAMIPQQSYARQYRISSSRIWYAALVPVFSLFIEMYAMNLLLGLIVWGACIVMSIAACLFDREYLSGLGIDVSPLSPALALLPPVYMFKRAALVGDRPTAGSICIITMVYALVFNGFTEAITMDKNDMINHVKDNYWSNVSGVESGSSLTYELIGDTLDRYSDEQLGGDTIRWSAEESGRDILVCAETDDGSLVIEFAFDFDGYVFGDIEVESLTLGGRTYEDEKAADQLSSMIDDGDNDDSSDSEGSEQ